MDEDTALEAATDERLHPLYREPQKTHKKSEYEPYPWDVEAVEIAFDIIDKTRVEIDAKMDFSLPTGTEDSSERPLVILDRGRFTHVETFAIDGAELDTDDIFIGDEVIVIKPPADKNAFCLSVRATVNPSENDQSQGMFLTGNLLVTQCESISFREIVPFPDRPDVMPLWTVKIQAPKDAWPVLLSNPNLIEESESTDGAEATEGTHRRLFQFPYPMPSYLFAMVAGDLHMAERDFTTMNGKKVKLQVYTESPDTENVRFGLTMLERALKWEEERWGIEYDLDEYGIVGVQDFNAGAMETKGLNVFSIDAIAGGEEGREDRDLLGIARTISHELGHNFRGNRIGVRTWHEIPLKEGFTVYAEQEFSEGLIGNAARLSAVNGLRNLIFPKDDSATTHPLSQNEYTGDPMVSGMYTAIPYQKGAEIIRMLETFVGKEAFRRGSDLYLEKFDGKAATIEDLFETIAEAGEFDVTQFIRWLKQTGVPKVKVTRAYNPFTRILELHVEQDRDGEEALQMPLSIGLIGPDGKEVKLELENDDGSHDLGRGVLNFRQKKQVFRFKNVPPETVPSLFRGFSAYADVSTDLSDQQYRHLALHDTDFVNRWDSVERIATKCILDIAKQIQKGESHPAVDESVLSLYGELISRADNDLSLTAETLEPPAVMAIAGKMDTYDFEAVVKARKLLMSEIAGRYEEELKALYETYAGNGQKDMINGSEIDMDVVNGRTVKNTALAYLVTLGGEYIGIAQEQFDTTDKMNDKMAALRMLGDIPGIGDEALTRFREEWKHDHAVTNSWLRVVGSLDRPDVIKKIREAIDTDSFDIAGTKEIFQLFVAGFIRNYEHVHRVTYDEEGNPRCEGYELVGEMISKVANTYWANRMIDELFRTMPKLDEVRRRLMQKEMDKLLANESLQEERRMKLAQIAA